jgi:hypothetical protein
MKNFVLTTLLLCLFSCPFAYAKDQTPVSRLTNNKTFYASEVPLLKPSQTLVTMRHAPMFEPISMAFDVIKAKNLAEIAQKNARFKSTRSRCMRWVRKALALWTGNPNLDLNSLPNDTKKRHTLPGRSGEAFKNWVLDNPVSLCQNLKLANVTEYPDLSAQKGVIYLYGKRSCGFSRLWGHAEILTDPEEGKVCSDHCRNITRPCKPDMILAPVAHCDWLHDNKRSSDYPVMLRDVPVRFRQKPILLSRYTESRPPAI